MTTAPELGHQPFEATPGEVTALPVPEPPKFGLHDQGWSEDEWFTLLKGLIDTQVVTWKDVTSLVLGHLNPSQAGTSLASSKGFKRKYGKGKTMRIVIDWAYSQDGKCATCQSRLELQADHVKGREEFIKEGKSPLDADFIENMTLRCRRCNVVKRGSHKLGGKTHLTAESALMWILFVIQPRTFDDFVRMCRIYGMTMSDIRMQEAWAMAHWLSRATPPAYGIEDDQNGAYDLLLWPDSAITRVPTGATLPENATRLYQNVSGASTFGFVTKQKDGRLKFHELPVAEIPFSNYKLGAREPQALCIHYQAPNRKKGGVQKLQPLSPRGMALVCHAVRAANQSFALVSKNSPGVVPQPLAESRHFGRLVPTKIPSEECALVTLP